MHKATALIVAAIGACVYCTPASAAGLSNRVWVSGHGVDQTGCGAPTAPCRSLQFAHDNVVAAGGEIDILDPGGYGAVTITKALSIVNDGVGTAGVQATSGDAITINAGPTDSVYLRGLNIDGVQGRGQNGVQFNSGGALTVTNCVIRHFFGSGILMSPASGAVKAVVLETMSSENYIGFAYWPGAGNATAKIVLDHFTGVNNNNSGVVADASGESGQVSLTLVNSEVSGDGVAGDLAPGVDLTGSAGNLVANIDSSVMNSNAGDGFADSGGAIAHLSRSVFDQNGEHGISNSEADGAAVFSTGDNRVVGNAVVAQVVGLLQSDPLH